MNVCLMHVQNTKVHLQRADFIDDAKETLADIPNADVVEVVRCKDCKYHDVNWDSCTRWTSDQFNQASVRDNDYCSCGERKTNDE